MRIRTWHRHPRADVALTTWSSVTVTVSDGVRSYSSQTNGTLNPFTNVLTGFPTKNGVCAIRFREAGSVNVRNTVLVDGSKTGEWAFDATSAGTPQFWSPYFILDNDATLTPLALDIFTPDDWRIMQMLGLNLFDALAAPYSPDGGGVFLLALIVLIGGWRHEGTELCSQTYGQDHLIKTNRHEHMGHPWIRQVDAEERIHPQMRRDTGRAARLNPNRMDYDTVPGIATDRRQHLQQGVLAAARDFRDPVRHVDHDAPARHTGTGGCDHTCHRPGLFRRRHRTLLSGLGVAA